MAGVHLLITLYLCFSEVRMSGTHLALFLWFIHLPIRLVTRSCYSSWVEFKGDYIFSRSKLNQQNSMFSDRRNSCGLHLHFHHNHVRKFSCL